MTKEKKYILTEETINHEGITLHRIKAIRDFGNVKTGDLGGWLEEESNLSHEGDCWIADNAKVFAGASVCCNAYISGNAEICNYASIGNNAKICDDAKVSHAAIYHNAKISDNVQIGETRFISKEYPRIYSNAKLNGNIRITGDVRIR